MGNQAKQPRSFNTIRNSQTEERAKRMQQSRIVLLLVGVLILVILLSLVALAICSIADMVNGAQGNNPGGNLPTEDVRYDDQITVTSSDIEKGELILVNKTHEYQFPSSLSLVNVARSQGLIDETHSFYQYANTTNGLKMEKNAFAAFENMMRKYYEVSDGDGSIVLTAAYRTKEQQNAISSSTPGGFSDHHTGYCIALEDGDGAELTSTHWILKNCHKFGFIMRYPDSKSDITKVSNYESCLRYVGVAHATYMKENDLCLEEYVELLQDTSIDNPLQISVGDSGSVVYYVEQTGDLTTVKVPSNYEYTVSGDNEGGIIITVDLSAPNQE